MKNDVIAILNRALFRANNRIATLENRTLIGSVTSTLTTVASVSTVAFDISVPGAVIGDAAYVTPPNAVDPRVSIFARVSANDVVTVNVNNPSAAATASITNGTWVATVVKGI